MPIRFIATVILAATTGALVALGGTYAYPRAKERFFPQEMHTPPVWEVAQGCKADETFTLVGPDTIIRASTEGTALPQKFSPVDAFSTLVEVPETGALDLTFKMEVIHRGDGYSEVIGAGAFITYQYAKSLDGLDSAPIEHPEGWTGGTNIRDLRDHYGQIIIVGALPVEPGYYRFCVIGSAHSALHPADDLAAVLVETKLGPLNTLRLSYKPGGRVLQ